MDIAVESSSSPSARTWRRAAACGSSPSTSSANRSTSCATTRASRSRSASASSSSSVRSYAGPPERYGLPKPDASLRRGAPDGLRAHPRPHPARHDRAQAEHRGAAGLAGALRRRNGPSTRTSSSTAPAIRSPSRSSTSSSSPRRTTTSSCSAASSIRRSRTSSSSACCSRSARSCRWPRRRARGWATTCAATTRCRRWPRCAGDIAADQAAMRWRYVASKRHTIQVDFDDYLHALAKERAQGFQRGRASAPFSPHCDAYVLPAQPFRRPLPDLQQDAARQRAGRARWRRGARATAQSRRQQRSGARRGLVVCACIASRRAVEDGYGSPLLPGLRASADAARLADEIAFSAGRLLVLRAEAPWAARPLRAGALADRRRISSGATWTCFLTAYLLPVGRPGAVRAGIRQALQIRARRAARPLRDPARSAHLTRSGARRRGTLDAYRQWVAQARLPGARVLRRR